MLPMKKMLPRMLPVIKKKKEKIILNKTISSNVTNAATSDYQPDKKRNGWVRKINVTNDVTNVSPR